MSTWFAFDSPLEARSYLQDAIERAPAKDRGILITVLKNLRKIWSLKHGCLYYSSEGELDLKELRDFVAIHGLVSHAYDENRAPL